MDRRRPPSPWDRPVPREAGRCEVFPGSVIFRRECGPQPAGPPRRDPRGVSTMRRSTFVPFALALATLPATLSAQSPGEEAAVKAVVQKYVDAREAEDPKAIEPLFTADADQLVSDGTWRRGRDALVRGM